MPAELNKELLGLLGDWRWRINNLYYIIDETGARVKFELNTAQAQLVEQLHYLNIVLKARQLGFTTFIQLFMLDACLFNSNVRAGTIAHTMDDAKIIFRDKVKYPYDNLPDQLKGAVGIVQDNLTELLLSNNSSIRVGISLRSGTLQYLHISEYGKICAKYPEKAREVRTGSLNTLAAGQVAFIESTAEGREGHFFELCEDARAKLRRGDSLTPLDFNFTFWPWWEDATYRLPPNFTIPAPIARYFDELEQNHGIKLDAEQKAWYAKKAETQLADMKREYPSTPDEAFEASLEGAYYGKEMSCAEYEGRIGEHVFIKELPVNTVWDIGVGDSNAIWFWQALRGKVLLLYYYQNSGEGVPFYAKQLASLAKEHKWRYGQHWFPHDVKVLEWGAGRTRLEELISHKIKPHIVPYHYVDDGINAVRSLMPLCYFNKAGTVEGVRALKAYRKEWNEELSCWRDKPRHDWASHAADAFRGLAMVYRTPAAPAKPKPLIEGGVQRVTLDRLFKEREDRQPSGMI